MLLILMLSGGALIWGNTTNCDTGLVEVFPGTRVNLEDGTLPRYNHDTSWDDGTPWNYQSDHYSKKKLSLMLGAIVAGDIIGFKRVADLQYNTATSSFHFTEFDKDLREYKQMDKIGHFIEAYQFSLLAARGYRWSGLSVRKSIWYGAFTGLFWMSQIEVTDGFFKAWGFSPLDYMANLLGCSYAILQQYYPHRLKGVRFKVSFWPSQAYKNKEYSTVSRSILDDYEGATFWLTINLYEVMPGSVKENIPAVLSPLGIAVGHGVQGIAKNVLNGKRRLFISLDIDLTKIPVGKSPFLKFLKEELNAIHLPLPAVQITPRLVVYGKYF
ncbi:MAG: DUF2279 domain-containing protein [Methanobacteriota archaeon]|nr:MAG: DUF2279 domain-containing protein [Euryarchaeota archaeon]